jgi:hypothetical protein
VNRRLFYSDDREAVTLMIANSEREFKEVAIFLRPDLKPESAYAWLKSCTSHDGDQHLRIGQVVAAMRFCNQFDPLYFMCDATLHDRPPQRAPEDQEADLVRAIESAGQVIERALRQLDVMRERRTIKVAR